METKSTLHHCHECQNAPDIEVAADGDLYKCRIICGTCGCQYTLHKATPESAMQSCIKDWNRWQEKLCREQGRA